MDTGLNIPSLTSFGEDGVGRLYVTGAATTSPASYGRAASSPPSSVPGDFGQPSAIAAPYGDPERLFIAELGGGLYLRAGGQNHLFIGLNPIVSTGGEQGLLSVAVAPDYADLGTRLRLLHGQRRQPRS